MTTDATHIAQLAAAEDVKLPEGVKVKWTEALDGGKFPQCTGHLFDGRGYCCLGVLGKVDGGAFLPIMEDDDEADDGMPTEVESGSYSLRKDGQNVNNDDLLCDDYAATLGLSEKHQEMFSTLNDGNSTGFYDTHPLAPVWHALAALPDAKVKLEPQGLLGVGETATHWKAVCEKHSFAEISAIIKAFL